MSVSLSCHQNVRQRSGERRNQAALFGKGVCSPALAWFPISPVKGQDHQYQDGNSCPLWSRHCAKHVPGIYSLSKSLQLPSKGQSCYHSPLHLIRQRLPHFQPRRNGSSKRLTVSPKFAHPARNKIVDSMSMRSPSPCSFVCLLLP